QFAMAWRGRTPDQAALAAFMADADRAHFLWKAAEAGAADAAAFYDSPGTFDVQTGRVDADGASVIFVALPEISLLGERPRIPRLHLVKRGPRWSEEDVPGTITGCEIVI
ncbi:MAG TPA: hypothetical protein VME40_04570, partial [Caulobacteraceae bacterium]|nr:hypothetical protein [Caulobacteraceae bacterium]